MNLEGSVVAKIEVISQNLLEGQWRTTKRKLS
jgi:hypothetical protein